jgi:predicted lipid-binding transport protein (Tim44 family)
MNLSPFELLILGVLVVVAIRVFSGLRRNRGPDDPRRAGREDLSPPRGEQDRDALMEQRRAEAYERARQAWGYLSSEQDKKSEPESQEEPPPQNLDLPEDFDYGDFLQGAKTMYARIKESWYNRDLEDIEDFATDKAFGELTRRAELEPRSGRIEILLIEAKLVDYREQGPVKRAQVFYDVLVKRGSSDSSEKVQEVWEFVQGGAYGDHWKLDDMKSVDEVAGQSQ